MSMNCKAHELSNNCTVDSDAVADLLELEEPEAIEKLKQLYTFLERRRLGGRLVPAFAKWIDLTGTSIVFDGKNDEQMVVRLLRLK